MEVKSIDALLNELNNVQLSKESMSGITGGYTMCYETKSGKVSIQYDDNNIDKIKSIRLNDRAVFNFNLSGGSDSISTTPGEICEG